MLVVCISGHCGWMNRAATDFRIWNSHGPVSSSNHSFLSPEVSKLSRRVVNYSYASSSTVKGSVIGSVSIPSAFSSCGLDPQSLIQNTWAKIQNIFQIAREIQHPLWVLFVCRTKAAITTAVILAAKWTFFPSRRSLWVALLPITAGPIAQWALETNLQKHLQFQNVLF